MIPVADGAKVCRGGCYVIEPLPEAGGAGCLYDGSMHPVNSVFYATDDCNICACGARGQVSCSKKVCPPCDSSIDDHRHSYIGKTPMECMTIRYKCPPNTTGFQNTCGCGCEQAASCPDFFNCQPSPGMPGCDTQMLQMQCPYSGIAF